MLFIVNYVILTENEDKDMENVDISGCRIETERLLLRPFEEKDLDDFYEYAKVEGVGEAAGWQHHADKAESKQILDMFISEKHTFAIVLKDSGRVVGSLGIESCGRACALQIFCEGKNVNELGYVLAKDMWGRGLMTEAVRAVIDFVFEKLNLDAVTCGHFVQNDRSRRVIEKCGFKYLTKSVYKTKLGTEEDCLYYAVLRNDWESKNR